MGSAIVLVALLFARALLVPVEAFRERQWARTTDGEMGPLLRDTRTRWARVVQATDATLARPGDVIVEWRGHLAVDSSGTWGVMLESAGAATVTMDGRDVAGVATAPHGEIARGRGTIPVTAGGHELVVQVDVPARVGTFRAVVRLPDGRVMPIEEAPVFTTPVTPARAAVARRFRAWGDPALVVASVLGLIGLVGALRRPDASVRRAVERAATVVVLAVAVLVPHGAGLTAWGTFLWGGVPLAARIVLFAVALAPWALAPRGPAWREPSWIGHPALAGAAAFLAFWILREGRFWGDAWITLAVLQDRADVGPFGPFFWKEPLDRLIAVAATRGAAALGIGAADAIAFTSCVAGAALATALAAHHRHERDDGATAAFVLTAGATLVFFGHVENYAWASAASVGFLLLAPRVVTGETPASVAGLVGGLAVSFHPITVSVVAPALVAIALARRSVAVAARLAAGAIAIPLALLLGGAAAGIAPPALGLDRFADDPALWLTPARAFAPDAWGDLANRMTMLLSPGILLGLAVGLARLRRPAPTAWPLLAAALGSAGILVFFHGKIRPPVEDWDLWAPVAFPWALLAARAIRGAEWSTTRLWAIGASAAVLLGGAWGNRSG